MQSRRICQRSIYLVVVICRLFVTYTWSIIVSIVSVRNSSQVLPLFSFGSSSCVNVAFNAFCMHILSRST